MSQSELRQIEIQKVIDSIESQIAHEYNVLWGNTCLLYGTPTGLISYPEFREQKLREWK